MEIYALINDAKELQNHVKGLLNQSNLEQRQRFALKHINADLVRILGALNAKELAANSSLRGGGEYTLKEIGAALGGVSRERIRQIEAGAIKKLKHPKIVRNFYNYLRA